MDEDVIDYYSNGNCHNLALALSFKHDFEVCVISLPQDPQQWYHVVVRIGTDEYLDVNGIFSEDELVNFWTDKLGFRVALHFTEDIEEFFGLDTLEEYRNELKTSSLSEDADEVFSVYC